MGTLKHEIGKIKVVRFGMGGYQEAMFGVSFTLGGDSWGIGDFIGAWGMEPSEHAEWDEHDQDLQWGTMCRRLIELMEAAEVDSVADLKNTPVEVTTEGGILKSWRILTEVI